MSKKPNPVVERSRNDFEDQVNVTSTSLSDRAFWTPSFSKKHLKIYFNFNFKNQYHEKELFAHIS